MIAEQVCHAELLFKTWEPSRVLVRLDPIIHGGLGLQATVCFEAGDRVCVFGSRDDLQFTEDDTQLDGDPYILSLSRRTYIDPMNPPGNIFYPGMFTNSLWTNDPKDKDKHYNPAVEIPSKLSNAKLPFIRTPPRINATWTYSYKKQWKYTATVVALKHIRAGEFIYTDYGDEYVLPKECLSKETPQK